MTVPLAIGIAVLMLFAVRALWESRQFRRRRAMLQQRPRMSIDEWISTQMPPHHGDELWISAALAEIAHSLDVAPTQLCGTDRLDSTLSYGPKWLLFDDPLAEAYERLGDLSINFTGQHWEPKDHITTVSELISDFVRFGERYRDQAHTCGAGNQSTIE